MFAVAATASLFVVFHEMREGELEMLLRSGEHEVFGVEIDQGVE